MYDAFKKKQIHKTRIFVYNLNMTFKMKFVKKIELGDPSSRK